MKIKKNVIIKNFVVNIFQNNDTSHFNVCVIKSTSANLYFALITLQLYSVSSIKYMRRLHSS